MNMLKKIALCWVASALVACGGGGGSSGTSPFKDPATNPTPGGTATAADVILTVSAAQVANTGQATVTVTATAIDSSRNTIPGAPIKISADSDGIVSNVSGATTGPAGTVTASLGTGANRANRVITVTAVSAGITKTATVQVAGTKINAVLVPAIVAPGQSAEIQYRVVDSAGGKLVNEPVQITATGFTPSQATGVTGINGDFTFSYTAGTSAGSFPIIMTAGGETNPQTITVQSAGIVPNVTAIIAAASISANPSVVSVNLTGATTNRSEIRALFLSSNNTPLANVRAKFDLNGDGNAVGGGFSTGTTSLYSDASGVVTTAYIPATRASPTNGVQVRVCYGVSDTDPNFTNCLNSKIVTLTVAAEPLSVSIGTNAEIIVNSLTYAKQFVVSVNDAAGIAVSDVNLVASVDLTNYRKGQYIIQACVTGWCKSGSVAPYGDNAVCANEDRNRNGVLDAGDDTNNDGQLWPRKADVIIRMLQNKTGVDGTAILQIEYAKDHGSWIDALITVSASGVSGSEGRASYLALPIPVEINALINATTPPAFVVSPYGRSTDCRNPN